MDAAWSFAIVCSLEWTISNVLERSIRHLARAVTELKTDRTREQTLLIHDVNRLHAIQPRLDVMALRADVIMIPVVFPDQLVRFFLRIIHDLAATVFFPQATPIAVSYTHLRAHETGRN